MTLKQNLIGFGLIACLAACATAQENPNYKYSSKFEGQEDVRMVTNSRSDAIYNASYHDQNSAVNAEGQYDIQRDFTNSPMSEPSEIQRTIYSSSSNSSSIEAGYQVPASSQMEATQSTSPEYYSSTSHEQTTPAAPTDTAYAGQPMEGTPGYGVYIPETTPQENVPYTSTPQGVVSANTNINSTNEYYEIGRAESIQTQSSAFSPAPTIVLPPSTNGAYIVKQGDTVYSLSRQLCVGVEAFQTANGIGPNFGIQIGQTLSLPESQC